MATHRQLMTLLGQKHMDNEARHDMIASFTDGRTESTKELTAQEVDLLVNRLKDQTKTKQSVELELTLRNKRSIVLKLATDTGIKQPDSWYKFNYWMKKSSVLKKPLYEYTSTELNKLIVQFRAIKRNYENSAKKSGTKAWYNKNKFQEMSAN